MSTFRGKPVFRPQGQSSQKNWGGEARRMVEQGGRVFRNQQGDVHIVSSAGSHWGTFKNKPQMYQGGSLQKYSPEEGSEDITESFYNGD